MIRNIPKVDPHGLYETKETAGALEVHKSTICRWHREGKLRGRIRKCNGHSVFSGEEIIRFWKSMI